VRSTLRAGCSALCGLPVGALPGDLGTGGRGGCADRGGVGRDGLRSSGMAPVHDHDLATTVYQRTTRADDRSLLTITIGERPPNSGRVRRVWWILFCGSRRPCRPGSAGQGSASQGSASQGSAGQGSAGQAAAYRADTRGHHRGSGECGLPDLLRAAAAGFDRSVTSTSISVSGSLGPFRPFCARWPIAKSAERVITGCGTVNARDPRGQLSD